MVVVQDQAEETQQSLTSLLYVSEVAVDADHLAWALADILTVSIARNTACDITGLLIATPRYFAQLMEGASSSLDSVMARIMADPRHINIRIVRHGLLDRRIGGSWRLLRFEPGSFEERHVTPVLARAHAEGNDEHIGALMHLMTRLLASNREPATLDSQRRGTGTAA